VPPTNATCSLVTASPRVATAYSPVTVNESLRQFYPSVGLASFSPLVWQQQALVCTGTKVPPSATEIASPSATDHPIPRRNPPPHLNRSPYMLRTSLQPSSASLPGTAFPYLQFVLCLLTSAASYIPLPLAEPVTALNCAPTRRLQLPASRCSEIPTSRRPSYEYAPASFAHPVPCIASRTLPATTTRDRPPAERRL
jgi:hypothetical protein